MMTAENLQRELQQALSQLLLGVGYAVGCFTLVSMFVLLVTTVGGLCIQGGCSRVDRAQLDLRNITLGLQLYRLKQGQYPSTEQGLRALIDIGALEFVPRDPWSAEYLYALRNGKPLIWSLGADVRPGGEGADSDQYSGPLPP